jgi:hypothetical protein
MGVVGIAIGAITLTTVQEPSRGGLEPEKMVCELKDAKKET